MENLVADQIKTAEAIKRMHTNMKKDSPSRKNAEYCQNKMCQLKEEWNAFNEAHKYLIEHIPETDEYFTKDIYGQAEKIYNQALSHIIKIQEKLRDDQGITEEKETTNSDCPIIKQQISSIEMFMRQLAKIEDLLEESDNIALMKIKQQSIENMWNGIISHEIQINAMDKKDSESYMERGLFDEANNKYEEIQVKILTATQMGKTIEPPRINLSAVTIPIFTGQYDSWPNFRDLFIQLVENNKSFGAVEKMQLLKTNLRGEPAKMIQHLDTTSPNYKTAWKLIEDRYNNPRLLFNKHMDNLLNFTNLNVESAGAIKKMHDTIRESTEALKNMNLNKWEDIIAYLMLRKLDPVTANLYEQSINKPRNIQRLDDLVDFLGQRFQTLEVVRTNVKRSEASKPEKRYGELTKMSSYHIKTTKCNLCNDSHEIYKCEKFRNFTVAEREEYVNQKQLCRNCLSHNFKQACYCRTRCQKCKGRHHTMLHRETRYNQINASQRPTTTREPSTRTNSHLGHTTNGRESKTSVLSTALIRANNKNDEPITLRALIDPGSQASFITTAAAQVLGKSRIKQNAEITGLGNTATESRWKINTNITPNFESDFVMDTELNIIGKVTNNMPSTYIYTQNNWENMQLADPQFHIPGPIDVLLGIDYFPKYMNAGFKILNDGLVAQNTHFGWIISGTAPSSPQLCITSLITNLSENAQLTKFWNIEEAEKSNNETTHDDTLVEEFYTNTVQRDERGYTVKLPFKKNAIQLGESRTRAVARLLQLENKLDKNEKLSTMYKEFMQEYIDLGHMKIASSSDSRPRYYIPHQPVIKEERDTTKLRVVFDASSKTSNGLSLNDILHTGPKLQQDLIDILIRWRKHKIAMTADIEKMYRQVKLDSEDQSLHSILWRKNKNEPIQTYELTTVTYGTAPAAFLAIRTMRQLAIDEQKNHPLAAEIILRDFYVDDLLSGADTEEEARHIQSEIMNLLKKGGFNIRKWKFNKQLKNPANLLLDDKSGPTRTLGISWTPREDNIHYQIIQNSECRLTKRKILSEIATIFDPLGLLSPVIIQAKMIMQEIWKNNTSWDESPPEQIRNAWKNFKIELPKLEEIQVQRWIHLNRSQHLELHGFSDASLKAYGAAVYTKTMDNSGKIQVRLLTSKSKVAPLRNTKTIPQLELCAALLLAKLIKRCITALEHNNTKIYAWSDSKVVLSWINADAGKWKAFIANRVQCIQELLGQVHWYYVKSTDNPADLISRGLRPGALATNDLWWNGPEWLKHPTTQVIQQSNSLKTPETTQDLRRKEISANTASIEKDPEILSKYSSFKKTIRIMAYCRRFMKPQNRRASTSLEAEELLESKTAILRLVQRAYFQSDIEQMILTGKVKKSSHLKSLNPFLDPQGLLRVDGRIHNAPLEYSQRHPIILPMKGHLTYLIIRDAHNQTLHGGNQATLNYLRQNYWIIQARNKVKHVVRQCVVCTRFRAETRNQLMGSLPKPRVSPSHPFTHSGVDYAGPVQIRLSRGRGCKSYKGYIAIFICLSTKAIHIEAVTDLTSNAFMAAFRRFISRRGICTDLYSDNGTNFVGAKKILDKETKEAIDEQALKEAVAIEAVRWHWNPPASPHHGGLWEAGVKSIKYHLKRVIGNHTLTYEELSTLLCQIEACLNSRPLTALSEDPENIDVITPGHFLIGHPLKMIPETPFSSDERLSLHNRWSIIQAMKKDFWKKWTNEYLTRLQHRSKWIRKEENLKIGDIVLIKQENVNPNNWPLAKVRETHHGNDGLVRVVTLRTKDNFNIRRPITKICKLPVTTENEQDLNISKTCTKKIVLAEY